MTLRLVLTVGFTLFFSQQAFSAEKASPFHAGVARITVTDKLPFEAVA
ncbi:hypothetical protein ACTOWA_24565 [Herbaspirillum seropedicae]